jgi:hypothetical protein
MFSRTLNYCQKIDMIMLTCRDRMGRGLLLSLFLYFWVTTHKPDQTDAGERTLPSAPLWPCLPPSPSAHEARLRAVIYTDSGDCDGLFKLFDIDYLSEAAAHLNLTIDQLRETRYLFQG